MARASFTHIFLLTGVLLVIIISFIFFRAGNIKRTITPPNPLKSAREFKKYWINEIKKVGDEKAYSEMKKAYANDSPVSGHLAAHLMGGYLYEEEGIDAIKICDPAFEYGCYHGLFLKAISDKGVGVAKSLDNICFTKSSFPAFCQHGIGHGLIEFFGYTDNGLLKALDECNKLPDNKILGGCSDGALMGYEFPLNENSDEKATQVRPMKTSFYEICDILQRESDKEACFYSFPQWWGVRFQKMAELCAGAPTEKQVYACLFGMGVEFVTGTNVDKMLRVCNISDNIDHKSICLGGAYWAMTNLFPEQKNVALRLCQSLPPDNKEACLNPLVY